MLPPPTTSSGEAAENSPSGGSLPALPGVACARCIVRVRTLATRPPEAGLPHKGQEAAAKGANTHATEQRMEREGVFKTGCSALCYGSSAALRGQRHSKCGSQFAQFGSPARQQQPTHREDHRRNYEAAAARNEWRRRRECKFVA